jgi:O-antigen/teichoic acid export membrane protein
MSIKRLFRSGASKNAAASYFSFISTSLWGLVSIPVAVSYLDKPEIGLWAVVNAVLGYLLFMDLGIGPATGRLMAEAVASNDQQEMNRWWSNTRVVLWVQGAIVILVGLLLPPIVIPLLDVPPDMVGDARILLIGGTLMVGLTMPIRGVAGLLTAQNRFHWVPLIQAIGPWVQLTIFFLMLRSGHGLISYVWAFAASRIFTWVAFKLTMVLGPHRFEWDSSGLSKERYRRLFGFCGNVAILGLVESFIRTLPNMLIARLSGLAAVPIYNFSSKGPMLGGTLVWHVFNPTTPDSSGSTSQIVKSNSGNDTTTSE